MGGGFTQGDEPGAGPSEAVVSASAGGVLVTLSLAPFNLWPMAIVAAGLLYFAVADDASRSRTLLRFYLFHVVLFGTGASWIWVSIHEHGNASVLLATVLVVLTDVALAGFGLLMLWYGAELTMFKWGSRIPLIQLPEGLRSLPLTVGGGLILLFALGHLVRRALGRDGRTDTIQ